MKVYITADNSDDKLPQGRWSLFQTDLLILIEDLMRDGKALAEGIWHSMPNLPTQKMCVTVLISEKSDREALSIALRVLVSEYEIGSIMWDEVPQTLYVFQIGD